MRYSTLDPKTNKRVWTQEAIESYRQATPYGRYLIIVEGLNEANCQCLNHQLSNIRPLEQISTYALGGDLLILLYLIRVNSELEVCFKVGERGHLDELTVEVLNSLSESFLWESLRGVWKEHHKKSLEVK